MSGSEIRPREIQRRGQSGAAGANDHYLFHKDAKGSFNAPNWQAPINAGKPANEG